MTCNSVSPACLPQELSPPSSHKPVIMDWLAVVIPVHTVRRFVKCGLSLPRNPHFYSFIMLGQVRVSKRPH